MHLEPGQNFVICNLDRYIKFKCHLLHRILNAARRQRFFRFHWSDMQADVSLNVVSFRLCPCAAFFPCLKASWVCHDIDLRSGFSVYRNEPSFLKGKGQWQWQGAHGCWTSRQRVGVFIKNVRIVVGKDSG